MTFRPMLVSACVICLVGMAPALAGAAMPQRGDNTIDDIADVCVVTGALAVAEARAASDVDERLAEKEHEQAVAEYEAALEANREFAGAFKGNEITRRRLAVEAAAMAGASDLLRLSIPIHEASEVRAP